MIVLLGLVVYGFSDLVRFSFTRAWAISSVSFAESIRRRVLWIAPLAILGVILVTQLQKPSDEQDAIRQTAKFALFATGLVVTVTAVILACTNLPKEIDTRVIYTVVTKPITRLEIILGKVIGFAKVSLAIMLIMGLFTYGYLQLRAWTMRRDIAQRLQIGPMDAASRPTYEYWAREGLLTSRTLARPQDLQVLAHEPKVGDPRGWFYGASEGDVIVPFQLSAQDLTPAGAPGANPGDAGVIIQLHVGFDKSEHGKQVPSAALATTLGPQLPVGVGAPATNKAPPSTGNTRPDAAPISIQLLGENLATLVDGQTIDKGEPILLRDPTGQRPTSIYLPPDVAPNILRSPVFYVNITGLAPGVEYSVATRSDPKPEKNAVCLIVPGATPDQAKAFGPMANPRDPAHQPTPPTFRTRSGVYGQQLRGGKPDRSPVAVFPFRGAQPRTGQAEVGFEFRTGMETSDSDTADQFEPTRVEIVAVNLRSGLRSDPAVIYPENNRTTYFNLPANVLQGGDFDLYVRNFSEGHYVGVQTSILSMVASQESFGVNLLKSLSILWMLSILVVIISVFCSTFLSWPIAVVLTLILLLGHWGVLQMGDALAPGIGNRIAQDVFGSSSGSASKARVVSQSVDAMAKALNDISQILPDISQFSAIDDIERGLTIRASTMIAPLSVLLAFGVPMIVLSYVLLRNKEVAP